MEYYKNREKGTVPFFKFFPKAKKKALQVIIIFSNNIMKNGKRTNYNAIAMYDYTIPVHNYALDELQKLLRENAKRWVFQTEQGKENDYQHYQVRLSLRIKKRFTTLKADRKSGNDWLKGHFTPTSNPTFYAGNFFYVMKETTRIAGPWTDKDDIKIVTTQLAIFNKFTLLPYQQEIYKQSQIFEMRKINLIWDTTGHCGKSLFAEWMEYNNYAEEVPPYRLMDDIFQWVASRPKRPTYIVDMPRGMKKDKLGDFYSGIEVIKNGVAYDKRNSAKKYRFNRPRIFIFTNTLPCFNLMSMDRWEVWKINKDFSFEILSNTSNSF